MRPIEEKNQIYISCRIWHEYDSKINTTPFNEVLQERINFSKYGDGINIFYFTFLVTKPNDFFKPVKIFDKKKKEADISVEIPFEKVEAATNEETIKLMEEAYLKGIDKLAAIKKLTDFDVASFKKDVQAIFAKEKWYEIAEAA
jgi:hypothetical protein